MPHFARQERGCQRVQGCERQRTPGGRLTRAVRLGDRLEAKFAPTTAQVARLTISEASGYPEIAEFQLFAG